jgi:hypothetical protein
MKQIIVLLILIFALCLSLPAMAADPLPAGVIAIAPDKMNWSDAKEYCASKGGRLPLINGKNELSFPEKIPPGTPVEVFGAMGAKWPSEIPLDFYWTGTGHSDKPRHGWLVVHSGGNVFDNLVTQGNSRSVICVP